MARAMNALCEMLPSKTMFKLGGEKHWALPLSSQDHINSSNGGMRKRVSSFSMGNTARSGSGSFNRSVSMPSERGEDSLVCKWWQWSVGWVIAKKTRLCRKMAIFEDEDLILGYGRSGWRQTLRNLRSHFRNLVNKKPERQGFNYDSFNYARNFDDGSHKSYEAQVPRSVDGKRYS